MPSCFNGGIFTETKSCLCPEPFCGTLCELRCINGGQCNPIVGSCMCPEGHYGAECEFQGLFPFMRGVFILILIFIALCACPGVYSCCSDICCDFWKYIRRRRTSSVERQRSGSESTLLLSSDSDPPPNYDSLFNSSAELPTYEQAKKVIDKDKERREEGSSV